MKNLTIAIIGLATVIVIIFFFSSKQSTRKDILIPEQSALPTEGLNFIATPGAQRVVQQNHRKQYEKVPPLLSFEQIVGKKAVILTDKGEVTIELFTDTPFASSNFIFLVSDGFYDGLIFHRREEKFVVQGGDPNGNGTGGPGYTFPDEPVIGDYKRGTVAMANAGPNTNGSQFFIILEDAPNLPKKYTIFGQVISGMEVIDKIQLGDIIRKVAIR